MYMHFMWACGHDSPPTDIDVLHVACRSTFCLLRSYMSSQPGRLQKPWWLHSSSSWRT